MGVLALARVVEPVVEEVKGVMLAEGPVAGPAFVVATVCVGCVLLFGAIVKSATKEGSKGFDPEGAVEEPSGAVPLAGGAEPTLEVLGTDQLEGALVEPVR